MTAAPLDDTTQTIRTLNIAVVGDEMDRIVDGTNIDFDIVVDKLTVTVFTYDAGNQDILVTASGAGINNSRRRTQDLGTLPDRFPRFVQEALREALPDDDTFHGLFASML